MWWKRFYHCQGTGNFETHTPKTAESLSNLLLIFTCSIFALEINLPPTGKNVTIHDDVRGNTMENIGSEPQELQNRHAGP
jgi:hypothetical protein